MSEAKDNVIPKEKWEFDESVADVFDNMLERSIPQYQTMRKACFDIAVKFQKNHTDIVDLGCSRGEAIAELVDKFGAYNRYIGIDISEPMLNICRARFEGLISNNIMSIKNLDLRTDYPPAMSCITLSVLTLQFTPIEYRLKILKNIYDSLIEGGALILVEKVLGASATIDELMVAIYYNMKRDNDYSMEQIERKRLSLEGVLVPVTAKWNEEMLSITGFTQVDCFWRWMNFAGWVAIK